VRGCCGGLRRRLWTRCHRLRDRRSVLDDASWSDKGYWPRPVGKLRMFHRPLARNAPQQRTADGELDAGRKGTEAETDKSSSENSHRLSEGRIASGVLTGAQRVSLSPHAERGVMSQLNRLRAYWFVWLVLLYVILVAVILLVTSKPSTEQGAASPSQAAASEEAAEEEETLTARVVEVLEEGTIDLGIDGTSPYQRLLMHIEGGSLAGQEVVVQHGTFTTITQERLLRPGDRVLLERVTGPYGDRYYISDVVRTGPLLWIAALFMGLVVLVGRGKGLRSLGGTLLSLLVIFAFVVPQILSGRDPVAVSVTGAIVVLAISTYLIYGWTPKAHAAVLGIVLTLILTGVLAWLFVGWTRLTGLGAEESIYLVMELGPGASLRGLVLGGIIIGSLGVLDDICVGQASAVFELSEVNRELEWLELFHHSLNIGRDHISATVNTLVLAYVGASLPLMLIFAIYQEPVLQRINREPIAEEIVRTLAGSIGLVLAVPITSLIASLLARWMVRGELA
jgi:uncharacterized membrane protein